MQQQKRREADRERQTHRIIQRRRGDKTEGGERGEQEVEQGEEGKTGRGRGGGQKGGRREGGRGGAGDCTYLELCLLADWLSDCLMTGYLDWLPDCLQTGYLFTGWLLDHLSGCLLTAYLTCCLIIY